MYALIIVSLLAVFALLSEIFRLRKILFPVIVLGLAGALVANFFEWNLNHSYFDQMMSTDNYALVMIWLILGISLLWFMVADESMKSSEHYEDQYALILFAITGAIVMVSYSNMVMLFLGIEILSIPMYLLAGSRKSNLSSNEAALKYFILGAFSTGFFLFGVALIYGVSGSFNLEKITNNLLEFHGHPPGMLHAGILLILCGLCFKIAAFPFHFWAPDVYEGSPDSIASFMGTIVKVASIAAFFRLFSMCFSNSSEAYLETLWVIAALSILAGNVIAIFQHNVKRMLAYSGIAHAGYLLISLLAISHYAKPSLLFYAMAYGIATLAAFTVLVIVSENEGSSDLKSFNGLAKKNPLLAVTMVVAMLSLAGIPPTAGFFGKYFLFTAALEGKQYALVLIALAGSLISIYYYFRVILAVFLEKSDDKKIKVSVPRMIVLVVATLIILFFGLFPDAAIRWMNH